jgi:hypothetical protein
MSIGINLGDDYESALAEHMKDTPLGISSSMAEDCFRMAWKKEHGLREDAPVPVIPNKDVPKCLLSVRELIIQKIHELIECQGGLWCQRYQFIGETIYAQIHGHEIPKKQRKAVYLTTLADYDLTQFSDQTLVDLLISTTIRYSRMM